MRKRTGPPYVALLLAATLATAVACATNPVTGKRELSFMSESQEISIGQELDREVQQEMGMYDDPALQAYVEEIGMRMARASQRPNLPWHFTVVDVPAVNAFALPGGYIYITRGILPYLDNEAELAGVLGHEIAHVTARHAAQAYTRATGASLGLLLGGIFVPQIRPFGDLAESGVGLLFLRYGRDDELQADQLGAEYAAGGGWDPSAIPAFLTTLGRIDEAADRNGVPNWLSTHPQPEDRVVRVQAAVEKLRVPGQQSTTARDAYLARIDGVVYGDNPEDGIVRGNAFLHPQLRFALEFPQGWEITNSETQVVAKEPGNETFMILQLLERPQGRNLEEIALRHMSQSGYRATDGAQTTINGLNAFVGTYQGTASGLGRVLVRAAHIVNGRNTYLLGGLAKPEVFQRLERDFTATIRSFRPLGREEADDIRPNRIDLYVARSGDTWQSIAERVGKGLVTARTLAIMNNHAVTDQPRPGERIKIVVAG